MSLVSLVGDGDAGSGGRVENTAHGPNSPVPAALLAATRAATKLPGDNFPNLTPLPAGAETTTRRPAATASASFSASSSAADGSAASILRYCESVEAAAEAAKGRDVSARRADTDLTSNCSCWCW